MRAAEAVDEHMDEFQQQVLSPASESTEFANGCDIHGFAGRLGRFDRSCFW
jgi:hypothetical protein